jgi:preprotein translocase subunit SecA
MYRQLLEKIEALQETLEVMQDEELMAAFREGVRALQNGETVAWEDAKRELGLS